MINKINDILNHTIIRLYQFFRFFTIWSLIIGVLFLKASSFMKAAAIVNILCCSIFGMIIVANHAKELSTHYSFTVGEIRIHDIVLHILVPVVLINALLKNMKRYHLFSAMGISVIIGIFYLCSMNFNQIYGHIPKMSSYILSLCLTVGLFHLLIHYYFKRSSS